MGVEAVHVLMVTLAWQGHMNPMLQLAKRLVSKGIHVTLATTEVARRHLMHKSNSHTTFTTTKNTTPKMSLEFFSDGLSLEFDRLKNFDTYMESLATSGYKSLSNLITNFTNDGRKFSCIISNPFITWVPNIAAQHDIPCAVLWIQACSIYSIYYNYTKNPNPYPSMKDPDASIEFPGLPILLVREVPSFILPSCDPALKRLVSSFVQSLDKVKWVLGNSFNELEDEIVKSMSLIHPICPIGPLVSPSMLGQEENIVGSVDMWTPEASCIEWLDQKPPSSVIYISFGSVIMFTQKQMDNLALVLKDSDRPFLWVIKSFQKSSGVEGGQLPPDFIEQTRGRGLVVTWCPQEKVLMHQSVACFITHCGWNSMLETVAAGVPAIAYPEWTDQPTVAKLATDVFKMGVRMELEDGVASPEEIERCIEEVTNGPKAAELKKRALELKEAAKKAVAYGGSSDQNIVRFISEFIGK